MFVAGPKPPAGSGSPQLALALDPETHEPKPLLKDRETLGHSASKVVEKGQLRSYQRERSARSLDGLPGLWSAVRDSGQYVWVGRARNWLRRHERGDSVGEKHRCCFCYFL